MTTRVDIQKEYFEKLKFPDACVVCSKENPDSSLNLNTFITINQPFNEPMFKNWQVNVPVCTEHKRNITFGRWISRLLFLSLVILTTVAMLLFWSFLQIQNLWINLGILVILLSIVIFIHSKLYAAPLLVESFSYRILFTFRDDKLAEKFAKLNGVNKVYNVFNQDREI